MAAWKSSGLVPHPGWVQLILGCSGPRTEVPQNTWPICCSLTTFKVKNIFVYLLRICLILSCDPCLSYCHWIPSWRVWFNLLYNLALVTLLAFSLASGSPLWPLQPKSVLNCHIPKELVFILSRISIGVHPMCEKNLLQNIP